MQVRLKYKNLLLSNGLKRLSSLTPWQPYSVGERIPSPQFSSEKFVHMKNTPRISDLLLAPLKNHDSWNPKDFDPGSISKDFHRANQSFEKEQRISTWDGCISIGMRERKTLEDDVYYDRYLLKTMPKKLAANEVVIPYAGAMLGLGPFFQKTYAPNDQDFTSKTITCARRYVAAKPLSSSVNPFSFEYNSTIHRTIKLNELINFWLFSFVFAGHDMHTDNALVLDDNSVFLKKNHPVISIDHELFLDTPDVRKEIARKRSLFKDSPVADKWINSNGHLISACTVKFYSVLTQDALSSGNSIGRYCLNFLRPRHWPTMLLSNWANDKQISMDSFCLDLRFIKQLLDPKKMRDLYSLFHLFQVYSNEELLNGTTYLKESLSVLQHCLDTHKNPTIGNLLESISSLKKT